LFILFYIDKNSISTTALLLLHKVIHATANEFKNTSENIKTLLRA